MPNWLVGSTPLLVSRSCRVDLHPRPSRPTHCPIEAQYACTRLRSDARVSLALLAEDADRLVQIVSYLKTKIAVIATPIRPHAMAGICNRVVAIGWRRGASASLPLRDPIEYGIRLARRFPEGTPAIKDVDRSALAGPLRQYC